MPQAQQQEHIRLRSAPPPQAQARNTEEPEEDDDEIVELATQQGHRGNHLTKNGVPDRRYSGQRDLPEAEVKNLDYTHPTVGFQDEEGIHRTKDGKPDRRFLENRTMSEDEAKVKQAEFFISHRNELNQKHH